MTLRALIPVLAILCCCAGLVPCTVRAQGDMLIGPAVGYEFGVPLGLDRDSGVINRYDFGVSGQSYNHTFMGGVQVVLPRLFGDLAGLSVEAGYARSVGSFSSNLFTRLGATGTGEDSTLSVQRFNVRTQQDLIRLDISASHALASDWMVDAGLWGTLRIQAQVSQIEEIVSPEDVVFPGGAKSRIAAEGDEIASLPLRYGARLSSSLKIPLDHQVQLRPGLFARVDAGALMQKLGIRSVSGGLTLSVLIDPDALAPVEMPDTTPPVAGITDSIPARKPLLEASVKLNVAAMDGMPTETARLNSRNILHRHYMPLLPAMFFEPGAAELPERYVRLSPAQADAFSRESLARLEALEVYHQTLNLIGWRLRAEPTARLTLHGSAAKNESPALARARAEQVAEYLRGVWMIESSRIDIRTGREPYDLGKEGQGCVQIASASDKVMAPVVTEWVEHVLQAPQLGLARSIRSEVGVKRWGITIRQGGDVISSYSSTDAEPFTGLDGAFLLRKSGDSTVPIVAELEVEDIAGTVVRASDELSVAPALSERTEAPAHEILTFTFAGLDRTAVVMARGNKTIMARMIDLVKNGSHVTVRGRDASEKMADWNAGSVAEELIAGLKKTPNRVAELKVLPGELNADMGGAEYPEHALIAAGATVTVEQESRKAEERRP